MRENIGLRRGVRAALPDFTARDVAHEGIHVIDVRAVVCALVRIEPLDAFFAHEIARVAHIAYDELLLAVKVIQELRVTHVRLGGDIAQGDVRERLAVYAALERHKYVHPDGFFINDKRHFISLYIYKYGRL